MRSHASRWRALFVAILTLGALAACRTPRAPGLSFGLHAAADPAVIARGRYLVLGPGHCASCHGDRLAGGKVFELGVAGRIVAPNLTSDPQTGIGAVSDDLLVRSLRYGISREGRPLAPFMSTADLADEDLVAILSFLRTVPPVKQETPATRLSWIGELGVNFVLDPQGPSEPPRQRMTPARSEEYGRYLSRTVAGCYGCHTLRSKRTGAFIGPAFAGGMTFVEAAGTFVTPNLTPVPGGLLDVLGEQEFVARFRVGGRALDGSPMPWEAYARMTDDDLGAIYRYLRTVPPVATPRE